MADSDSEDEQVAAMARDDSKPDIPFDSKTTVCVLDMRSMCELPVDLETNGVSALRALLLPLGKTLHVPGEPGCYVTDGDFRQQMALCKVYSGPWPPCWTARLCGQSSSPPLESVGCREGLELIDRPKSLGGGSYFVIAIRTLLGLVESFLTVPGSSLGSVPFSV